MTEVTVPQSNCVYDTGATGDPDHVTGTFPEFGRVFFDWGGSDAPDPGYPLNVSGFKVVFDASSGTGDMFWDWTMDNPGWPDAPSWTADPDASHIAMNNSYDGHDSAIHVDGATHYEWSFHIGDPTFGGFLFSNPTNDLMQSLNTTGAVFGSLQAGAGADSIVVTRFDLVVFTLVAPPPLRRHPRSDGLGVGPTRHWPPPAQRRHLSY